MASDAGDYRVIVTNSAGSVASNAVILIVNPKPAPLDPGLEAGFFRFSTRLKRMPNLAGRVADLTRIDAEVDYRPTALPWPGLDARFAHAFAVRESGFLYVHSRPLQAGTLLEGWLEAVARRRIDRQQRGISWLTAAHQECGSRDGFA
jgi:hypothetical protein